MDEEKIREIVQDELKKRQNSFEFNSVPFHTHNNLDAPFLDPNTALTGFPIRTSTPSDAAFNGKIVLSDIAGVRRLYARIGNVWYSVILT